VAWLRVIGIGLLGIAGFTLGNVTAVALGVVVCAALVTMLGLETYQHRDALRQLR
jgi:hypothetical protein